MLGSFAEHFPLLAAEAFHLFSILCHSAELSPPFLAYVTARNPLFFFHLLHSLPLTPPLSSSPPSLRMQQRRFLLECLAQQLFQSPSSPLLSRLTTRDSDGSLYLLSVLTSLSAPLPSPPSLPAYAGSFPLSSTLQHTHGHPTYHLPSLYTALTLKANLSKPDAQRLCDTARQWNIASQQLGAVVEAGQAWAALTILLAPHLSSADVSAVVSTLLACLVGEDPASLALSSPLSPVLLHLVAQADEGELVQSQVAEQLMDAVVNHSHPTTRANLYALLLLFLHPPSHQRDRLLASVVGQGGRVLSLLIADATEGSVVVRGVACALLCHVASSPASLSLALPFLRDAGVVETLVGQVLKRDEDLRMTVLSPRPAYLPTLHLYTHTLTLLSQLSTSPAGRSLLIDADALPALSRLTVVDLLIERDLHTVGGVGGGGVGVGRYWLVVGMLMRLMVGMLWSRHAVVVAVVVRWLRAHQEVVTAVVKGREVGGLEELQALQVMAQLLERVEAAGRDAQLSMQLRAQDNTQFPSVAPAAQRGNATPVGVSGHLRGLLKFVGVSVPPAATAPQPIPAAPSAVLSTALVPADDAPMDRAFLARYDRLLMMHLHMQPLVKATGMDRLAGEEASAARELRELQEETVRSVLSLCCMRMDYGRDGKAALLFFTSLASSYPAAAGSADSAVTLGTLVDLLSDALDRIQHSDTDDSPPTQPDADTSTLAPFSTASADQRRLAIVELGLLLLLRHVQVGVEEGGVGGGRRMVGEGWRESARGKILPMLEVAEATVGNATAGTALGREEESVMSSALVVSSSNGKKRSASERPQSLFVSAFTRRLRKLLL